MQCAHPPQPRPPLQALSVLQPHPHPQSLSQTQTPRAVPRNLIPGKGKIRKKPPVSVSSGERSPVGQPRGGNAAGTPRAHLACRRRCPRVPPAAVTALGAPPEPRRLLTRLPHLRRGACGCRGDDKGVIQGSPDIHTQFCERITHDSSRTGTAHTVPRARQGGRKARGKTWGKTRRKARLGLV